MYLQKSFVDDFNDACNSNHDLDASGFTCSDKIVNSQMLCKSISGFDCIPCRKISGFDSKEVTVGISPQRCYKNIFHRDASRDDHRNPLLRDAGRDDRKNSLLRDVSRDDRRNSLLRDVSRDDSRDTSVEMPSYR